MYDIPDSLRSLVDPNVMSYDPSSGHITYRSGYKVTDTRKSIILPDEFELTTAEDIRNMSLREFGHFRAKHGLRRSGGILGDPEDLAPSKKYAPTALIHLDGPKAEIDLWKEAREQYVRGEVDIEAVLKHVNLDDSDKYDQVVEEEGDGIHKHGFNWRRWTPWWWLARWLHR